MIKSKHKVLPIVLIIAMVTAILAFTVLALVYGTVTLVSCGSVGGSDGEALLRARLCEMIFAL